MHLQIALGSELPNRRTRQVASSRRNCDRVGVFGAKLLRGQALSPSPPGWLKREQGVFKPEMAGSSGRTMGSSGLRRACVPFKVTRVLVQDTTHSVQLVICQLLVVNSPYVASLPARRGVVYLQSQASFRLVQRCCTVRKQDWRFGDAQKRPAPDVRSTSTCKERYTTPIRSRQTRYFHYRAFSR
ncbi:hypothetical protein VTK56DRAFT_1199 [Thermocarpiscus australiensis]